MYVFEPQQKFAIAEFIRVFLPVLLDMKAIMKHILIVHSLGDSGVTKVRSPATALMRKQHYITKRLVFLAKRTDCYWLCGSFFVNYQLTGIHVGYVILHYGRNFIVESVIPKNNVGCPELCHGYLLESPANRVTVLHVMFKLVVHALVLDGIARFECFSATFIRVNEVPQQWVSVINFFPLVDGQESRVSSSVKRNVLNSTKALVGKAVAMPSSQYREVKKIIHPSCVTLEVHVFEVQRL